MLSQLTIRNFAIVDHLEIDWHSGLNVITGETGAGKSILIDAVGALLGDRLGPEIVRSGASRALIEGVFIVASAEPPADLKAVLDEYGLEPEDGALIVSREIAGSGGLGGARINGRGVPLSVIQELGELLVDVHGQSEHMALLRACKTCCATSWPTSRAPTYAKTKRTSSVFKATGCGTSSDSAKQLSRRIR